MLGEIITEREMAKNNLILEVVTGSQLYGFSENTSDTDYQGIFIPSKPYVYGLHKCEQIIDRKDDHGNVDKTVFNFIKFIQLAKNNNPNIISILYTPENRICHINKYGKLLMDNKNAFLSKKCYHTYRGYAHQQKAKLLTKSPDAGSKRKELVEKYGYDTKYACHLIRLLYECLEILVGKTITYPLANARDLLKIRKGGYDLNHMFAEATRIENLVDEAYLRSDLQYSPDIVEIENIQMEILVSFWEGK